MEPPLLQQKMKVSYVWLLCIDSLLIQLPGIETSLANDCDWGLDRYWVVCVS